MKKIVFFSCLVAPLTLQAQPLITAVFDGPRPGGLPKGVELFITEDIADLSVYGIGSANNGNPSSGVEFTFPSIAVSAGDYLYVASEAPEFENFFGFAPDFTTGAMSINGDDAIELFENGGLIDVFGEVGVDGTGQAWEYTDGWAYRLSGTTASATFFVNDWFFSGPNALDGEDNNAAAVDPVPVGTFANNGEAPVANNIIINELDSDTDGTDVMEFIELYDGGVGNTDLSGLSLVLFNGSNDSSYNAVDLDGFSTNANGYFVLGNPDVSNVGFVLGNSNAIQNGADAAAVIVGDAADFPNGTPVANAVNENLLDAIVYGTNDPDDEGLLVLLNANQAQVNESANNGSTVDSNQRCPNGAGGARNTDAYIQAMPSPGADNNCPAPGVERLISEIQGTPATQGSNNFGDVDVSPLIGQQVIVQAIVVGDFQDNDGDDGRNLRGFFLQEERNDEDGDPASSEGVFVFDNSFGVDVQLGDLVRVAGTVDQFFGETQIDDIASIEIVASNQLGLVDPALISLLSQTDVTLNQNGRFQPDLEAFEGMLVTIVEPLEIIEQFQLDRFNEIRLAAGGRPVQFSQTNVPNASLFAEFLIQIGARQIVYDDGLNVQNADVGNLDGFANYAEANAKRMGDVVQNLSGVLDYKFAGNAASGATWRVRSNANGSNTFTSTLDGNTSNPRPATPDAVSGNLKVASFNVLNFFTTLNQNGAQTAVGLGPRGANNVDEFFRQLAKTVNALVLLDADVVGLIEIENEFDDVNDSSTAIEVLVNALNAQLGSDVYDYVFPGETFVGTDAIAVAVIYKRDTVEVSANSQPALLDDSVAATLPGFEMRDFIADPIFNGPATNRVPLAVSFTHLASAEQFTVVVNHFKSKGQSGLNDMNDPNFDQLDGAGFWNQRRLDAAMALRTWLQTSPTGVVDNDQIIVGDLNAYAMEAPVQFLLGQGFNNVEGPEDYSFVFDGQIGTLDYVLLSDSLLDKFTEATVWHINADEADALDYNLDFGRNPLYFDGTTATRNSDHDPLIAGLDFAQQPVVTVKKVLENFVVALNNGEITGAGRHPILRKIRVIQFARILVAAKRAEQLGQVQRSCKALLRAELFSDGEAADLIKGTGVAAIQAQLDELLIQGNCRR